MPSASKKILKEAPTPEQVEQALSGLDQLSHRDAAIIGLAHLDRALEFRLRHFTRPDTAFNSDERNALWGNRGVVGSISAKIAVAYAFSVIGPNTKEGLVKLNDIRNVFAHSIVEVSFDDERLVSDIRSLPHIADFYAKFFKVGMVHPPVFGNFCLYISSLHKGLMFGLPSIKR